MSAAIFCDERLYLEDCAAGRDRGWQSRDRAYLSATKGEIDDLRHSRDGE